MGPIRRIMLGIVASAIVSPAAGREPQTAARERYLLLNLQTHEIERDALRAVKSLGGAAVPGGPRLGVAAIISYLRVPRAENVALLRQLLELCREEQLAVLVQLDGEQWWNNRPDLWNWWDRDRPGYDPANAANVEWCGWGSEHALKISWRDWGQQRRVLPPPNLMSARYRAACHEEMAPLLEEIVRWRGSLAAHERWLLVGVKVGWESAIGMSNRYYPGGNALLEADAAHDPNQRVRPAELPGRGYQAIGYAAVSTAGLARQGELREAHLAEVVRRHLEDLAAAVRAAGFPRAEIFTHCGGWAEGELLYRSALNAHSCPGWSFYRHGRDPRGDRTAMAAVASSDAPYWAVAEWLPIGARNAEEWQAAIGAALGAQGCRYVCAFNWREIARNVAALEGIRRELAEPITAMPR